MMKSNKKLTILNFRNVSTKECVTTVYGAGTGHLISFLFSWINWQSSPDLTSGMYSLTAAFEADTEHKANDFEE